MNKPAPVFTIAPTSQRGQSLLQWHEDNDKLKRIGTLHSLQMPDHVAAYIVDSTTVFDRAGRELGIDAAELARIVNLAALLRMVKVGRCNADARADMGPLDADMVRLLAKLPH